MAGQSTGLFRSQLRALFDVGTAAGLTDGQLLERFGTRRDETGELAFAALVERHGVMVLRTCRGILRDEHEAMDAFQATFLVLARQGSALWTRDSLGPWLHRVACQAAYRAQRAATRRRGLEKKAADMADLRNRSDNPNDDDRDELASVIHDEVNRLPERFRAAIVLCELEGRTCEEAARHLGCPVGTVASRLSRARERLRERLRRRGLPAGSSLGVGLRALLPPNLPGATAVAAAGFFTTHEVPPGSAASLALEVLASMALTRCWKVAVLLCALGASTTGVVSLASRGDAAVGAPVGDAHAAASVRAAADFVVLPAKLRVTVTERGSLLASRSGDGVARINGNTEIVSILPEGKWVRKGDLVCELDSTAIKGWLSEQQTASEASQAAYESAERGREAAELAVREYMEGTYNEERRAIAGEIALGEASVARAQERVKRTRSARDRMNTVISGQANGKTLADMTAVLDVEDRLASAEHALDRERQALEVAHGKRAVLEKLTYARTVKELEGRVEQTRSEELVKKQARNRETAKQEGLEAQIASCRLLAPNDGFVVYDDSPNRVDGPIKVGAIVHPQQRIFSILDTDAPMIVNVKAHESTVHLLKPGLTARIVVDTFPDQALTGVVMDVAPRPERPTSSSSNIKVYTTHIEIKNGLRSLRPGMTAAVEVLVAERDDVLSVPLGAIVRYDHKDRVAVKTPDGELEWREVTLGMTNGEVVEVTKGLEPGEHVVREPAPLRSDEPKKARPSPAP